MATIILSLAVTLLPAQDLTYDGKKRSPNPLAPSLPLLTEVEYAKIEGIIDRFIEYDIGKVKGGDGKKALAAFNALGPEAIPSLIDGLNKAAKLEHSCPAVIIGEKLSRLLRSSRDLELLEYARETIGAGVKATRHRGTIQKLRLECMLRKTAVQRQLAGSSGRSPFASMPIKELAAAADREQGPRLKLVLQEVEKRQGPQVLDILCRESNNADKEIGDLAGNLLQRHLSRKTAAALKSLLSDERAEVRAAAARIVGAKKLAYAPQLIDLIADSDTRVSQAARQALVRITGQDLGPEDSADSSQRSEAASRWREWWSRKK